MKPLLHFLFGVCLLTTLASLGMAGIILSIQPATTSAAPGSSGDSFDVVLTNTGPSGVSIAGFNFELTAADPDVTLTQVTFGTAAPYIFSGISLFGPVLNSNGPGATIDASDLTSNFSDVTIASNSTVGLGHVFFSVAPNATLVPGAVSFSGGIAGNSLTNAAGQNVPIDTLTAGSIDVVVPEPATFLLVLPVLAFLAMTRGEGFVGFTEFWIAFARAQDRFARWTRL
jgi:hypothetical protein